MHKQDFTKLQSCVLRVNIDCDGCRNKVKKLLQKIDGVYTTDIDAEQGKVTVTGNIAPVILIRKLEKSGKHAELWVPQKGSNNNYHHLLNNNQLKNMSFDNGNKAGNKQPKSGGQQQQQQLIKGSKDINKVPQKDQKSVKFNLSEDDFDDEDEEFDDDDDDDDGEFDDDDDELGPGHGPHNGMNVKKGSKKGGGIDIPMVMMREKDGKGDGSGGKKASKQDNKGGDQDKKSGKTSGGFFGFGKKKGGQSKNSEKSSGGNGGGLLGFGKKSKYEEGFSNKNGKNGKGAVGNNNNGNGPRKSGPKNDGAHEMGRMKDEFDFDFGNQGKGAKGKGNGNGNGKGQGNGGGGNNMGPVGPNVGPMGQMGYMGQMGGYPMGPMTNHPTGQVGGVRAVQGLPASAGGYYPGMGPASPYENQQYMAMMMNQQQPRMNGNDMFQPLMYAMPHPAINYGPPPMAPTHASENYTHFFSDENANSCSIM